MPFTRSSDTNVSASVPSCIGSDEALTSISSSSVATPADLSLQELNSRSANINRGVAVPAISTLDDCKRWLDPFLRASVAFTW